MQAAAQGGEDSAKLGEAALPAGMSTDLGRAALKASSPPRQASMFTASQSTEVVLGPADSNVSDATQGPNWLQRWAALLMPSESSDPSQASMQQFMTNITVAMQQAQREGMQLPQAQEVLAGLMSLASVQSPALPGGPEAPNKGLPQAWRDSQKMAPIVREASGSTLKQNLGGATRTSEKRQQPMLADGEPHKIARTSQSNPRSETLSMHPANSSQASWYRAPILIQQRSNPEIGEIPHFPVKIPTPPVDPQKSGSKSHFRVYSNAFQEPLPAPRWGASKTARGKAREDARASSGSESRFRPQVIVTGATGVQKTREVDSSEREQPRRRTQWGVANPVQQATNPTSVTPKLANSSSTAGLTSNKPAIEPSSQPSIPHEYAARSSQAADRSGPDRGPAPFPSQPAQQLRPEQALPPALESQLAAAAWLRQRGLHPLMGAEAGMNPFVAPDMSSFANALAKLPMQAQQQQGGPAGMPPHVSQLMHLQQLAQSLGSSTAVTPWQLPLSQSQPPANYPTQQQWKEAMLMHAAKAGHPTGPAKVYYQQTWPADKDSLVNRGMYAQSKDPMPGAKDSRAHIKPVPRRPLPDIQCHSPSQQLPGQAVDARTHLEQMLFSEQGFGKKMGGNRPVADLPSDRSLSTPVSRAQTMEPDLPRLPSTESSLTGSHTIDINNPFEVHREQLALELSPKKEATNASVKPPLVRNLGGSNASRRPAFQPVVPPSVVVRHQHQGSQSPPARTSEERYSSSPSSDFDNSKTEDEEMAAQTLLSLVVPVGQERGSLPTEGSITRRPRSHRPRGRRS